MAAPNYEQIQSFGLVRTQLVEAAVDEFNDSVHSGMTRDEVIAEATRIAEKFAMWGCELGAQWYDLCSELAGLSVDPATYDAPNPADFDGAARRASDYYEEGNANAFADFLQSVINDSIRTTGSNNLWRDYERGLAGGKWARVPVGQTCAWCLMLASQGAWYLSERSALGDTPDHYHRDCNCIAVYHADAESIAGYTELRKYKEIYYDAENRRLAAKNGSDPYPDDLAKRIAEARWRHDQDFADGVTDRKWTPYNETLIVMRYYNEGLK